MDSKLSDSILPPYPAQVRILEREAKKQEFFEFEQVFHNFPVDNWLKTVDNHG
jgi:hypothetical protein